MAKKINSKENIVVLSKNTFAETILDISYRFSLHQVFEDFLTMAIAACSQNPVTNVSYYEEDYLSTIATYKDSELRHEFPKAFANLVSEMEDRLDSSMGNDVLGDFFEQHISNGRNGQFFTPYPICQFMASLNMEDAISSDEHSQLKSLKILDPACGSGRMLVASHRLNGPGYQYYGIDIDRTCVKMTALNMFLNGMWNSEVMCANSLMPEDFIISYKISLLPLGIFKVENKEHSLLWNMHRNSFDRKEKHTPGSLITLDQTPFIERTKDNSTQLDLF